MYAHPLSPLAANTEPYSPDQAATMATLYCCCLPVALRFGRTLGAASGFVLASAFFFGAAARARDSRFTDSRALMFVRGWDTGSQVNKQNNIRGLENELQIKRLALCQLVLLLQCLLPEM